MTPNEDAAMDRELSAADEQAHFRRTLVRVMAMQAIALTVLWLLQARYTP